MPIRVPNCANYWKYVKINDVMLQYVGGLFDIDIAIDLYRILR